MLNIIQVFIGAALHGLLLLALSVGVWGWTGFYDFRTIIPIDFVWGELEHIHQLSIQLRSASFLGGQIHDFRSLPSGQPREALKAEDFKRWGVSVTEQTWRRRRRVARGRPKQSAEWHGGVARDRPSTFPGRRSRFGPLLGSPDEGLTMTGH